MFMACASAMVMLGDIPGNVARTAWNVSLGPLFGHRKLVHTDRPINIRHLVKLITDVHGYQVFQVGAFNGDPHPGNVMMLDDGRLGLVDFGQVGVLSPDDRTQLAQLLALLREKDYDAVPGALAAMGFGFQRRIPEIAVRYARFHFSKELADEAVTGGMNPMMLMEWLNWQDPLESFPEQYALVLRMQLVLSGFQNAMGLDVNFAHAWRGAAEAWLKDCPQASRS